MRLVGPNCLGVLNTVARAERDVRPDRAAARHRRLHVAERRHRDRRDRARPRARPRPLVVRLGGQQGRPLRQRLPPVLGARTRPPTSSCSTSSRSGTRAASPGSRRASRRRSRSWPSSAGRSAAGARAAGSHTGALLAASDVTVDALFRQAGVIRTDTLGELFDVAALLAGQPLPGGPSRRDPHQRRRPGHPRRRRVRRPRARRPDALRRRPRPPCAPSPRPRRPSPTRST